MDGVFQGLAGLLRGIFRGRSPREIPRSSAASPRKAPSFPTHLLRFTFYFQHGFSKYWGQQASKLFFLMLFQLTSVDKLQIMTQLSCYKFVVQNIFVINYFVVGPLWKVEKKSLKDCDKSLSKSRIEYHIFSRDQFFRAILCAKPSGIAQTDLYWPSWIARTDPYWPSWIAQMVPYWPT